MLNRALRQMLVAEQCFRTFRPQVFVSLPLTHLSEQLDFRGPKAFSQQEVIHYLVNNQFRFRLTIVELDHANT